jgi:hypothetical protein
MASDASQKTGSDDPGNPESGASPKALRRIVVEFPDLFLLAAVLLEVACMDPSFALMQLILITTLTFSGQYSII